MRSDTDDFRQLFLSDTPLIDVRAPVEFAQGAFPAAINLPLINDSERAVIGTRYKQAGQEAAITLGHSLINGETKVERLASWRTVCEQNPNGYLYCFRGGLRSHIVQEWLAEAGVNYPLVTGGYKALRNYLLAVNQQAAEMPITIIGGNTGSGKTRLIIELDNGIDLEGKARHRGSSFGRTLCDQSVQVDFENRLAISFLKKQDAGVRHWVLEDEGRTIGSNHVPPNIYAAMASSGIAVIEDPFEVRLARLQQEYIDSMWHGFKRRDGEELGWLNYNQYLHHGLFAIRKRLGLERFQQLTGLLDAALGHQLAAGDSSEHRTWLIPLLKEYYDPMYSYQLSKKTERVLFCGDYSAVRDFVLQRSQC